MVMLSHSDLVDCRRLGRIVLELGCGVGLTGMCLQQAQPACLILSDGNTETLRNCAVNLDINACPYHLSSVESIHQTEVSKR